MLLDGYTSALALALGASQGTVQRVELEAAQTGAVDRARRCAALAVAAAGGIHDEIVTPRCAPAWLDRVSYNQQGEWQWRIFCTESESNRPWMRSTRHWLRAKAWPAGGRTTRKGKAKSAECSSSASAPAAPRSAA